MAPTGRIANDGDDPVLVRPLAPDARPLDPTPRPPEDWAATQIRAALEGFVGSRVPSLAGSPAGHTSGSPIEEAVRQHVRRLLAARTRRHHEVINDLLRAHPEARSRAQRTELFASRALRAVFCARTPLARWSPEHPFEETQQDFSDDVLFADEVPSFDCDHLALEDVKSVNLGKSGRPPNIVSARRLFDIACAALEDGCAPFDLVYVAVGWRAAPGRLCVERIRVISLFRCAPDQYINWSAAQQIQFDPFRVDQDFAGSRLEWLARFADHFVAAQQTRGQTMMTNAERDARRRDEVVSARGREGR